MYRQIAHEDFIFFEPYMEFSKFNGWTSLCFEAPCFELRSLNLQPPSRLSNPINISWMEDAIHARTINLTCQVCKFSLVVL
jgi:hypothetical protein